MTLVRQLLASLERRFRGLLNLLQMSAVTSTANDGYGSMIHPISAVLDPEFGFLWLDHDHPGTQAAKKDVKDTITG